MGPYGREDLGRFDQVKSFSHVVNEQARRHSLPGHLPFRYRSAKRRVGRSDVVSRAGKLRRQLEIYITDGKTPQSVGPGHGSTTSLNDLLDLGAPFTVGKSSLGKNDGRARH
jgi:hypothetical protein